MKSIKVAFYNTKSYERKFFDQANTSSEVEFRYFEPHLNESTYKLAEDCDAVCVFVNDRLTSAVIGGLKSLGVRLVALRCAGFNNVDIVAAEKSEITILRVPAYSPHGVAEHAIGMILALNRKIHRAHNRIREGNFSIDGLMGFELRGQTVGIVGTGKIGTIFARIIKGFGTRLVAYDPYQNPECLEMGVEYVSLPELFQQSDIISLHLPLDKSTYHIVDWPAIEQMKSGVMLINISRGGLINTPAVIRGLKAEKIGYLGLDVYEEEEDLFFEDLSDHVIQDDLFSRLLTFPNVIVTGHQAFFTREALSNIAETTVENITGFFNGTYAEGNEVTVRLKA